MDIHEFKKQFDELYNSLITYHHTDTPFPNTITFYYEGETVVPDEEEGLAGLTEDGLMGCGCPVGINVHLKKEPDNGTA